MEKSASIVTDTSTTSVPSVPSATSTPFDVNVDGAASVDSTPLKRARKSKASKASKSTKSRTSSKPTVDTILAQAYQLNSRELAQLISGLMQLQEVLESEGTLDDNSEQDEQGIKLHRVRGKRRPRIESKMINGCGPYNYLRWWHGKTYKSTYLGKSKG